MANGSNNDLWRGERERVCVCERERLECKFEERERERDRERARERENIAGVHKAEPTLWMQTSFLTSLSCYINAEKHTVGGWEGEGGREMY